MTFLVTGANGFVGKHLCAGLLQRGQAVRAAVRSANSLVENVEQAAVGAIDNNTDWSGALHGIEVVIHLAARVPGMKDPAADPLAEYLKVNLFGTENLAQQAARAGVKRLVYASSVKVNGEQTLGGHSFTELDQPAPTAPYAISKWRAEQALRRIAQQTGLEIVVVRPPLVYGPGVKGNFISLLAAIDKEMPLPLAGAHNTRSLVYVGNLVDALIACATHPAAAAQTYLVGDGEDISTAMLAEKISHALGRGNRSFYFPPVLLRAVATMLGCAEPVDRLFSSLRVGDQKIRNELGWVPPYSLEQGLRVTADWYAAQRIGYNLEPL